MDAPVLFLIFNRPDLTARVFTRIREARPKRLYIAADGPRPERVGEFGQCDATRAVTAGIDWPCEVFRLYRDANLGCKVAVSEAISWFFENEEEGIILEDDCLVHPDFFQFAGLMLARYRDEPKVMFIGAANFQNGRRRGEGSYYFSRYAHVWGWASWRRVWKDYDVSLAEWPATAPRIADRILTRGCLKTFSEGFDAIKRGKLDTWDFQLSHQVMACGGLAVVPQRSLVQNIGFDERATHTHGGENLAGNDVVEGMDRELVHPTGLEADDAADLHAERTCFNGTLSPALFWWGKITRLTARMGRRSEMKSNDE